MIALSIGIYFMYISPGVGEINALNAKKTEFEQVLLRAKELNDKRDTILTQKNNIPADELDKLNKIIPNTYDSVAFVNDMNNLAAQNGVTLKTSQDVVATEGTGAIVADTAAVSPFKSNTVNFSVIGTYDNFLRFLTSLESSLRLVDVKSLNIKASTDSKTGQVTGYEYKLEIAVYSLN